MRKNVLKHITAPILSLIILGACTDLTEHIYSAIPIEDYFSNEKEMISNASRAYSKLQPYCTEQSLWTLSIMTSDEGAAPVNANGSWAEARYEQLQKHTFDPSNKLVRRGWEFCFDGIASCNEILYETELSNVDFESKENIIAEVKILRAFYYFMAVDGWGNVPFSIDYSDPSYPEQKDRKFMFEWIEKEILENAPLLSDVAEPSYYGRATQGMAYTLLGKLYMMSQEWTGVERWADAEKALKKVIDSGQYSIEPIYNDNFKPSNESSCENIFVIPYSTVHTQSDRNSFVIYMLVLHPASCATFNITATPWDGLVCQPDFFSLYSDKDSRRSSSWLYGQQYDLSGSPIEGFVITPIFDESLFKTGRGTYDGAKLCKWSYQTDGLLSGDNISMENDFALFRLSDVVLLWAEALVRQNRAAEAVSNTFLQDIRRRASLEPYTAAELTLDEILAERGRELAWEGWRRSDLIRHGKWNNPWWAKGETPKHTKLFPIPREARASNPNLKQNPGY